MLELAERRLQASYIEDIKALLAHFGIVASTPGAAMDLALSSAHQFEKHLFLQGPRVCYAELCQRYGIEPYKEGADTELFLRLAPKHVWSKRVSEPRIRDNWGTRFNTLELAKLLIGIASIKEHLEQNGRSPFVRMIAEVLRDRRRLLKFLSPAAADSIQKILLNSGNKKWGRPAFLSNTYIRQTLIPEIVGLLAAVNRRRLSPLQKQLDFAVLPLLHGDGQNSQSADRP